VLVEKVLVTAAFGVLHAEGTEPSVPT